MYSSIDLSQWLASVLRFVFALKWRDQSKFAIYARYHTSLASSRGPAGASRPPLSLVELDTYPSGL